MYPVLFRSEVFLYMARHGLLAGAFWPWPHLYQSTRTIKMRLAATTGIITSAISGHLTRIAVTAKEWAINNTVLNM